MKNNLLFFLFITPYFIVAQTYIGISIGKDFSEITGTSPLKKYADNGSTTVPYIIGIQLEQNFGQNFHLALTSSYYERFISDEGYFLFLVESFIPLIDRKYKYINNALKVGYSPIENWKVGLAGQCNLIPSMSTNTFDFLENKFALKTLYDVGVALYTSYNFKNLVIELGVYRTQLLEPDSLPSDIVVLGEFNNITTGFTCTLTYRFKVFNPIRIKNKKKVKCAEF